jgi:hypothetical protein
MAFDVQAAKAEGYTDEEIAAYLRSQQGTPVPVQEQPSRTAEVATTVAGTGAGYLPEAVAVTAAGYGLKKYGPDIMRNAGNIANRFTAPPPPPYGSLGGSPIGSPVSGPVAPTPMNVPVQQTTSAGRALSPQAQQFLAQRSAQTAQQGMTQQVQKMAFDKLAPAARAMAPAAVGLGALTYSAGLNSGEDEELRRRRMMAPTISRGQ